MNIFIVLILSFIMASERPGSESLDVFSNRELPDPLENRASGYLIEGELKTVMTNYGNFIQWDHYPAALWNGYTYLPSLSLMVGIPGKRDSYHFTWTNYEDGAGCPESLFPDLFEVWCSHDLYENSWSQSDAWFDYDGSANYSGFIFENKNDYNGIIGIEKNSFASLDNINQWHIDHESQIFMISLPVDNNLINPNNSNVYGDPSDKKTIGLIYPWALRPNFIERDDAFDVYDYGEDDIPWSDDDIYDFYGSNVTESWFTRWNPSSNTDWHASSELSINNTTYSGDLFGEQVFVNEWDNDKLLPHSSSIYTWHLGPEGYIWPGNYAQLYDPYLTGCFPEATWNDGCYYESSAFVSDNDVYMEFDDRWAHRGNNIADNGQYESKGYPMGLKVMVTGHSYSHSLTEDILFFTMQVRNESGDNWVAFEKDRYGNRVYVTDSDGSLTFGNAMIMPDGTKINNGLGFDYRELSIGYYMDADVVSTDILGNFGVHTNNDDFMEYYDCANPTIEPDGCEVINNDTLRVSMAMMYDYDGWSGVADSLGYIATQLLDTPYANRPIDLNQDGIPDIYPGDKLKMTDWHWFDWYNRPGVVYREGSAGCCAGDPGKPHAVNKEDIQYKLMSGDTTNLSNDERAWFFHTDEPSLDDHENSLNPHFDSLDGLELTSFFTDDPDGLDCVMILSSGPFDLEIGEQINFSFALIMGSDKQDLIANANIAQLMYNNKYQFFSYDFSGDAQINVIDIIYLINVIIGIEEEMLSCDINFDGNIDVLDIIELVNIVMGQ